MNVRDLLPFEPFGLSDALDAARLQGRYPLETGTGANLREALALYRQHRHIGLGKCKNPRCNNPRWGVWCRTIKTNGTDVASLRCLRCGWEMRAVSTKRAPAPLPVYADHRRDAYCERCGAHGDVEEHHWAPKHLFGFDEAEEWPTALLCLPCHRRWHQVVTPTMNQRKAS